MGMIYHCGKFSSHRIWRRLQVSHPFRDFVWLKELLAAVVKKMRQLTGFEFEKK